MSEQNEIPTPRTSALVEQLKRGDTSMDYFTLCCNLEKQLAEALKWKEEDPRMLREQIRVADVAFNHLHESNAKAQKQLTELRGLADAFSKSLEVEKDDAAFANVYAFKIALTNYKAFLDRP